MYTMCIYTCINIHVQGPNLSGQDLRWGYMFNKLIDVLYFVGTCPNGVNNMNGIRDNGHGVYVLNCLPLF